MLHGDGPFVDTQTGSDDSLIVSSDYAPDIGLTGDTNVELPAPDQESATPGSTVQRAVNDTVHQPRRGAAANSTPPACVTSSGRVSKPKRDPSYVYS